MNFMASRQGFYEDDTRGGSLRPFSSHSSSSSSSSSTTTASASASASFSQAQQKAGLTSVPMSSYHHHLNLNHQTRRGWDEFPTTTSNTTNFRCSRQQGGVSHLDLMMDSSSSSPSNNNNNNNINVINNGDDVDDSDDHLLTRQVGGVGGGVIVDSTESQGPGSAMIEREHMFDKVVTPSDVGKLNRLVIPKQHAEKYFPLDSSTNEKGLLLNFEDRNGKPWRFRYSYWNSSQSYVMTKGWSRFVKEKKLDAGDIVSFQRGVGELGKDRLFIDWRRRPDAPDHHLHYFHRHHQHLHPSVSPYSSLPHHHFSFHPWSHPYYLQQQQQQPQPTLPVPLSRDMTCQNFLQVNAINNHHLNNTYGTYGSTSSVMNGNPCPSSLLYLRSSAHHGSHHVPPTSQQVGIGIVQLQRTGGSGSGGMEVEEPMVYESVPVVQGKAAAKRFRLFGVNMECPISGSDDILSSTAVPNSSIAPQHHSHFSSSSPSSSSSSNINTSCQLRPYSGTPVLQTMSSDILNNNNNNNKGKTSMSLDFDV